MTMNLEKHTQLIYCKINKPYKETSKRTVENKSEIKSNPFLQPKHSNKLTQSIQNIFIPYTWLTFDITTLYSHMKYFLEFL